MRLLIVEDDNVESAILVKYLQGRDWICDATDTGEDALQLQKIYGYDCVLVDLGLPDMSGFEIVRRLAQKGARAPVMVISGDNDRETVIRALKSGAADYVTKPYRIEEVVARILALTRRAGGHAQSVVRCGSLEVDLANHVTYLDTQAISLSRKEAGILEFMALNKGKVISKEELLDRLYGDADNIPEPKIIDVFICKMRKKLENAKGVRFLHTAWGQGYVLLDPDEGSRYEAALEKNRQPPP
jgi:two-component system cell cycle response regulator CtrA